jgi:hypothetical protein
MEQWIKAHVVVDVANVAANIGKARRSLGTSSPTYVEPSLRHLQEVLGHVGVSVTGWAVAVGAHGRHGHGVQLVGGSVPSPDAVWTAGIQKWDVNEYAESVDGESAQTNGAPLGDEMFAATLEKRQRAAGPSLAWIEPGGAAWNDRASDWVPTPWSRQRPRVVRFRLCDGLRGRRSPVVHRSASCSGGGNPPARPAPSAELHRHAAGRP